MQKNTRVVISALDISIVFLFAYVVMPVIHEAGHLVVAYFLKIPIVSYNLFAFTPYPPYFVTPNVQIEPTAESYKLILFFLGGLAISLIVFISHAEYERYSQHKEDYIYALGFVAMSYVSAMNDLQTIFYILFGQPILGTIVSIIPCILILRYVILNVCVGGSCRIVFKE